MNWSSLDGAQKRPQNGTDRRKGWGRALGFALPSSLRRLYGPLDGWSAETLAPPGMSWYRKAAAGKIQQPGLATRFTKADTRLALQAVLFVAPHAGAWIETNYPEHLCFHCIVYGAVMREASCLPVPL